MLHKCCSLRGHGSVNVMPRCTTKSRSHYTFGMSNVDSTPKRLDNAQEPSDSKSINARPVQCKERDADRKRHLGPHRSSAPSYITYITYSTEPPLIPCHHGGTTMDDRDIPMVSHRSPPPSLATTIPGGEKNQEFALRSYPHVLRAARFPSFAS